MIIFLLGNTWWAMRKRGGESFWMIRVEYLGMGWVEVPWVIGV
jgi:hypothetical protein